MNGIFRQLSFLSFIFNLETSYILHSPFPNQNSFPTTQLSTKNSVRITLSLLWWSCYRREASQRVVSVNSGLITPNHCLTNITVSELRSDRCLNFKATLAISSCYHAFTVSLTAEARLARRQKTSRFWQRRSFVCLLSPGWRRSSSLPLGKGCFMIDRPEKLISRENSASSHQLSSFSTCVTIEIQCLVLW